MNQYKISGEIYPSSFHAPIKSHTFKTEMQGINSEVTVTIDDKNRVNCIVKSTAIWDPDELLGHVELLVQNTLNSIAFFSGITTEVFFNYVECPELGINVDLETDYKSVIASGIPSNFLAMSFSLIKLCSSEYGWHLTRSLNEFRLALRHPLDGGFYCYRSIECLRVYCRDRFNLTKENAQWEKLRSVSGVSRSEIDKIKIFADPNRHGDFQGISGEDRIKVIHSTRDILDRFFRSIFNDGEDNA